MSNYKNMSQMADLFKALGNVHRLQIYLKLVECCCDDELCCDSDDTDKSLPCVGEIGAELEISPSTLSHHLKELSHAGLITMERSGRTITCAIDQERRDLLYKMFGPDWVVAIKKGAIS